MRASKFEKAEALLTSEFADNAYITYPKDKSTQHAVILFPDFMGYELINAKLYDLYTGKYIANVG